MAAWSQLTEGPCPARRSAWPALSPAGPGGGLCRETRAVTGGGERGVWRAQCGSADGRSAVRNQWAAGQSMQCLGKGQAACLWACPELSQGIRMALPQLLTGRSHLTGLPSPYSQDSPLVLPDCVFCYFPAPEPVRLPVSSLINSSVAFHSLYSPCFPSRSPASLCLCVSPTPGALSQPSQALPTLESPAHLQEHFLTSPH